MPVVTPPAVAKVTVVVAMRVGAAPMKEPTSLDVVTAESYKS